jgi:hypothetical protein
VKFKKITICSLNSCCLHKKVFFFGHDYSNRFQILKSPSKMLILSILNRVIQLGWLLFNFKFFFRSTTSLFHNNMFVYCWSHYLWLNPFWHLNVFPSILIFPSFHCYSFQSNICEIFIVCVCVWTTHNLLKFWFYEHQNSNLSGWDTWLLGGHYVLNFLATCVKKDIYWEPLLKRILVFHILLLFKFITFAYLNYFTFFFKCLHWILAHEYIFKLKNLNWKCEGC